MQSGKRKQWLIGTAAAAVLVGGLALAAFRFLPPPDDGPPQNDMTIAAAARNEAVENIAANLSEHYVFAQPGKEAADKLRARLKNGAYDGIDSAEKFARALTRDLRADLHDLHLEVRYFEKPVEKTADGEPSAEDKAEELEMQRWLNAGVENVSRLKGNLGYIDVRAFARPPLATAPLAATMGLVAMTKGLIIDLRQCGGGDPDTVMLWASYLFDRPTHLNDLYSRDEDKTEERWTSAEVGGQRYGEARPVYVLTSSDTASGCEDLAYALKYAGRAKIVGETTAGAAHAGSPRRIGEHFMMFVPGARPVNPVTHTDWEGTGVAPDIATSSRKALDAARVALLTQLVAVETEAPAKRRMESVLADAQ